VLFLDAFAGPSIGYFTERIKEEGKGFSLPVDLSAVRDAVDIGPSRLQADQFETEKSNQKLFLRIGLD